MLVGDQYAVELFGLFANRQQTLGQLAEAKPGVNQQTRAFGGDKRRVAAAAASQ
jgi:hypothetical protein